MATSTNTRRLVRTTISTFYPDGQAITVPAAATSGPGSKPGATDPLYIPLGSTKWMKKRIDKTEQFFEGTAYGYVPTAEVVLSKGQTMSCKLEKQSVFAMLLAEAAAALLPAAPLPTTNGIYNPDSGSPVVNGWLHGQIYDGNGILLDTWDRYVAMKATETNYDDKPSETSIECLQLFNVLNVGNITYSV